MERLTKSLEDHYFSIVGNKTVYNRNPKKSSRVTYALEKLFQYEETGLEPQEIKMMKDDYDSLN